jgi:hypothetical protein
MSVSAIRPYAPHRITFSRNKRARRFLGAMSVALRETGCRTGETLTEERENFAVRSVSYDASWRLPAAA